MTNGGDGKSVREERWVEALAWHVMLRDATKKDLSDALGHKWQRWYTDPENQRIFDDVSRLFRERGLYRMRTRCAEHELTKDRYDLSVSISEWRTTRASREAGDSRSSIRSVWLWLSGGIGVAAVAALFALWPLQFGLDGGSNRTVVYQTAVGGLRDVYLPDASSIILGGHTKVSVAYSPPRRSITLLEGQAWFHVTHDPHWPFIVAAGDGTITDVGTAFLVTRESDRVVVTVTEGIVEVSARPALSRDHGRITKPELAPIRVSRGEELSFSDSGTLSLVKEADTHAAIAWTHGRLIFDDQPLRYVIETIDRYSSRRIVVSHSVGALRFSGVVFNNQIREWLASLEVIFPVTVEEHGDNMRIVMRHSASGRR